MSGISLSRGFIYVVLGALTSAWLPAYAGGFEPGKLNPKAPPETTQFGQFAGRWAITDETLQPDGTWKAGPVKSEWDWHYILDGYAIQDDWISPVPGVALPEKQEIRQYGTNLRIYNPKEKRWDLAWLANTGMKIDAWRAHYEDGKIIMDTDVKRVTKDNPEGYSQRITFYDIQKKTFEWKIEFSKDDGATWAEVYRIHGHRIE